MTDADSSTSPEEKALCRFAVFEQGATEKVMVAQVTPNQGVDRINFKCTANSEDILDRISRVVDAFRAQSQGVEGAAHDWQTFIALFPSKGLAAEEIPLGDSNIEIHFDMQSGGIVGAHQPLHPYAQPGDDIARNVVAALGHAFPKACDDLADRINGALDSADLSTACKALEEGQSAIYLAGTPKLLDALERMDASKLDGECKTRLLDSRLTTAQRLKRFDIAGRDAAELLKDPDQSLTDGQKAALEMQVALAAVHRGNRETGISLLKKLLKEWHRLEPGDRGWAWRNLSLALDKDDLEARRAARLSADAFLEAGHKEEAGKSLMHVVDLLMGENPQAAVDTLDEMMDLLNKQGLGNQAIYAAALHARAQRLMNLGQAEAALSDAVAAVDVHRKLLGTQEQMVSTMHLAAQAARMKGDEPAATAFEAEATELADHHSLSHFKLAKRLVALGQAFNAAEADALLHDAEAAENFELAVSVQVFRANGDISLDDGQRLGLLEETLRNYRGKATPRILNMVKTAIAVRLRDMGSLDRAADWFEKAHVDEPMSVLARDSFIDCLGKDEQWGRAANVFRKDLQRRGEAPGLLYGYSKSLFESGDVDGALTAAARSIKLSPDPATNIFKAATELRDKALDLGGKLLPVAAVATSGPVSREEFEAALREFGNFVKAKKRMTFWRTNDKKERVWASSPEAYAQTLLHTYMQAKFGDRVDIFEELDTGAGRLDLYVKLEGGLSVIVELKMCGHGYSSNYAAAGETQIVHYMDNRKTNIGYLVIFDARATIHAQSVLSTSPQHTIVEVFVDVRPDVV
jgi:tetratricopeptide (TPR) repeat protein